VLDDVELLVELEEELEVLDDVDELVELEVVAKTSSPLSTAIHFSPS
jgi:hypothetical protein